MRTCQRCGAAVELAATRCPRCGYTSFVRADEADRTAVTDSPPTPRDAERRVRWLAGGAVACVLVPLLANGLAALLVRGIAPEARGGGALFGAALALLLAVVGEHGRLLFWLVAAGLAAGAVVVARRSAPVPSPGQEARAA